MAVPLSFHRDFSCGGLNGLGAPTGLAAQGIKGIVDMTR
jgi:hypothetical protein